MMSMVTCFVVGVVYDVTMAACFVVGCGLDVTMTTCYVVGVAQMSLSADCTRCSQFKQPGNETVPIQRGILPSSAGCRGKVSCH